MRSMLKNARSPATKPPSFESKHRKPRWGNPRKFAIFKCSCYHPRWNTRRFCGLYLFEAPLHPRKVMLAVHRAACTASLPLAGHARGGERPSRRKRVLLDTGRTVLRLYGFAVHQQPDNPPLLISRPLSPDTWWFTVVLRFCHNESVCV
jgi:hypothetical protein